MKTNNTYRIGALPTLLPQKMKPTIVNGVACFLSGTEKRFFCHTCKVWVLRTQPCPGCGIRDNEEGAHQLLTQSGSAMEPQTRQGNTAGGEPGRGCRV
jgi:hypothetical protein